MSPEMEWSPNLDMLIWDWVTIFVYLIESRVALSSKEWDE